MSQQPPNPTARLETLADGVFAIVMTLLVFNLSLPKDREVTDLAAELAGLWPNFAAYAISFALVGIYWVAHQNMYRYVRRTSHELVWLTILFLAFVSLVPFSASVLARFHTDPTAVAVYGGNLVLIGLSMAGIWAHACGGRRLVDPDLPARAIRYGYARILTGAAGYAIGTGLGYVSPGLALAVFAVIPLLYIVPQIQQRWAARFGMSGVYDPRPPR